MNSVNSPTSLSTVIVPPCCVVTMSWLIERPRPVPSPVGLVVKNGWNSFSRCSGAMPVPLSRTLTSTALRRARVATLSTGAEAVAGLAAALIGGIEAVANQVKEHARHVLRHDLDRCEGAVEVAFHRDVEALVLGAGAVIGEVEGLIDQRVEINLLPITATPARVLQHALDDAVRPPSVLGDLVEIARQHRDRVIDLGAGAVLQRLLQDFRAGARRHRFAHKIAVALGIQTVAPPDARALGLADNFRLVKDGQRQHPA